MSKKLVKHGNSLALVIDKPILELMHFKSTDEFEMSTDGEQLIIRRSNAAKDREHLDKWLKKADKRFGEAFKALSKPA